MDLISCYFHGLAEIHIFIELSCWVAKTLFCLYFSQFWLFASAAGVPNHPIPISFRSSNSFWLNLPRYFWKLLSATLSEILTFFLKAPNFQGVSLVIYAYFVYTAKLSLQNKSPCVSGIEAHLPVIFPGVVQRRGIALILLFDLCIGPTPPTCVSAALCTHFFGFPRFGCGPSSFRAAFSTAKHISPLSSSLRLRPRRRRRCDVPRLPSIVFHYVVYLSGIKLPIKLRGLAVRILSRRPCPPSWDFHMFSG